MPKVNEISVAYSTHGLGADERDVIARLNNHGNVKCSPDLSNERFIVSAKAWVLNISTRWLKRP